MSNTTTPEHADAHGHDEHHVVGWKILTVVFVALMILTILTVAAINVDLGPLNIVIALGIALVKALLVIFIFMHVLWDRAFHGLLIASSFAFVAIFLAFTMIDTTQYDYTIHDQDEDVTRKAIDDATYVPPPALGTEDAGH